MKIKDFINNTFGYKPKNEYQFTLPDNPEIDTEKYNNTNSDKIDNIYSQIDANLKYIKSKYNTLINSDIITREFTLNTGSKQYKAFILYIDGMVDSQILNDFVLKPLMLRNKFCNNETSKIILQKGKNSNIANFIQDCLIPQNNIKQQSSFKDIFSGVNSGNCALFVDTLSVGFDIDVKGFKQRSISKHENEIVIKGPHEAFVENIRTNTTLLRRFTNNENLLIENIKVGKITQTNCAICYIKDIANDALVAETKYRLNNLEIDS